MCVLRVVSHVLCRCVPESPRWLIQKGRITEAKVIVTRIAEFNRKPVPDLLKLNSCVQVGWWG